MAETKTIVGGKKFTYTGLFSAQGLYRELREWLSEHGYNPYEKTHTEEIFEDGKQILILFMAEKKVSDYVKIVAELSLDFIGCKEVVLDKGHASGKMYKGTCVLNGDVLLQTDYNDSFEQNAFQYFLRTVIDKFVFKSYISRAEAQAKKDYTQFEHVAKDFLNAERLR